MTVWEPDQTAASLQILYAFLNCYEMDLVEIYTAAVSECGARSKER